MEGLQQPPPKALPLCSASFTPGHRLWRGTQRKRRDAQTDLGPWAGATASASPTACPAPGGHGCPSRSLPPAGRKLPQTRPGQKRGQLDPYGAQDTAGSRKEARGAEEGCGRRGRRGQMRLRLTCYTQVGPVLPCLSLPSYGMGAGGRLWRQRGQAEAWSRARGLPRPGLAVGSHLQVAPYRRCPWLWLLAPGLLPRAPGARASAPACGDGGGLGPGWAVGTRPRGVAALPAGSFSTRSPRQRPAASASGARPCVACKRFR